MFLVNRQTNLVSIGMFIYPQIISISVVNSSELQVSGIENSGLFA
jgi:hypothetical protein